MEQQIPFGWRIYRDRPQICYNLATLLLHEIHMGGYRKTKYLPSYEKMAKKYSVSVSTMRRSIHVLNEIGAVRTVNGKGTYVFTVGQRCENPDFTSTIVRRNLSCRIQSFELLFYTGEEITRRFIKSLCKDEREEFTAAMIKGLKKGGTNHCATAVKVYIQGQLPVGKEYLMQNGIKAEELRLFPSIRLLLLND